MSTYHVTKCNHQPLRIFSFSRCLGNGSESYVFIRQFPPRSLLCLISSQQKKIFRCSHQERLHIGFQGDRLIFSRGENEGTKRWIIYFASCSIMFQRVCNDSKVKERDVQLLVSRNREYQAKCKKVCTVVNFHLVLPFLSFFPFFSLCVF